MKVGVVCKLLKSPYGEILQAIDINFCKILKEFCFEPELLIYSDKLDLSRFKGVIISGGNDLPTLENTNINFMRDEFEDLVISQCLELRLPILGICKGAQKLAQHLGANFIKVKEHTKPHIIEINNQTTTVNSFHNYAIYSILEARILATSNDGNIEAFINEQKKMIGAMWHFERCQSSQVADKIIFNLFKDLA